MSDYIFQEKARQAEELICDIVREELFNGIPEENAIRLVTVLFSITTKVGRLLSRLMPIVGFTMKPTDTDTPTSGEQTTYQIMYCKEDLPEELDDYKLADMGGAVGSWSQYALYFIPNKLVKKAEDFGAKYVAGAITENHKTVDYVKGL